MAVGKSDYLDITVMPQSVGKVRLFWREDYDVASNTSTITVTDIQGYLWHKAAWAYVSASLTADTVTVLPNTGGSWMFSANTDTTLRSVVSASDIQKTFTPVTSEPIVHDADGTKTVTLTFTLHDLSAPDVGFDGADDQRVAVTVALTEIPRASAVTVSGGTIGSPLLIAVERVYGGFTHTLTYTFGAVSAELADRTEEVSFRWTPPMELCREIPDADSGTCTVTCHTYNGSTLIGTRTADFPLSVPRDVGLTLSEGWAVAAPYNVGTAAEELDIYVQGYSAAQVTFDSTKLGRENAYGADIAGFAIEWNGSTNTQTHRTGVLTAWGSAEIRCIVTDTRGRSCSEVLTINVLPYAKPTLSGMEIFRCTSDGTADDGGTAVRVTAECGFSPLDGHNRCLLLARYRSPKGSYGNPRSVESGSTAVLWAGELSPRQTYQVQLTATDALGNSAVYAAVIPTDDAFFHGRQGGKGAAFGKYAEEDDLLEVAWNILGKGRLTVEGDARVDGALSVARLLIGGLPLLDYVYPVGRILLTDGEGDPALLYGGRWEQLENIGGHEAWKRLEDLYTGAAADLAIADLAVCE